MQNMGETLVLYELDFMLNYDTRRRQRVWYHRQTSG
jgi:hypothetical protein